MYLYVAMWCQGPTFPEPLSSPSDMLRLIDVDVKQSLGYVFDAITLTRRQLEGQCPLIGFSGAPVGILTVLKIVSFAVS